MRKILSKLHIELPRIYNLPKVIMIAWREHEYYIRKEIF